MFEFNLFSNKIDATSDRFGQGIIYNSDSLKYLAPLTILSLIFIVIISSYLFYLLIKKYALKLDDGAIDEEAMTSTGNNDDEMHLNKNKSLYLKIT